MTTQKVKLNTSIVGNTLHNGKFAGHFSYAKGDVIDMPADEAKRYIERGMAQPVTNQKS